MNCGVCGAEYGKAIGIVVEEGASARNTGFKEEGMYRHPCEACIEREAITIEREFGDGVPGLIADECRSLRDLLLSKNKAYGNSALDPVRIFSKADSEEQIRVRLDDKLSRLSRGSAAGEDVEQDLLGYLILLRVARRLKQEGGLDAVRAPPGAHAPLSHVTEAGVLQISEGVMRSLGIPKGGAVSIVDDEKTKSATITSSETFYAELEASREILPGAEAYEAQASKAAR